MPYYKNKGYKIGDFPLSEDYYNRCISLPIFPSLKEDELSYVIDKVLDFFK